jgi:hypothetical protein
MLANKRRRRRARRHNPFLNARRRTYRKGSAVKVRHVLNRRRRRQNPRRRSGVGGGMGGFLSAKMLTAMGYGALGALAPTLVTDRVLPMIGLQLTGLTRRLVQFAVPAGVLMLGGRKLLGAGAYPFAVVGMSVTAVGLVNDLTGGAAMLSGYGRPAPVLGRYTAPAPALR